MRLRNKNLDLFPANTLSTGSSQTTASRICRILRDKIISMQLLPGMATSEQEIANMLGVSRTPVREAFIRLSREKLLIISPQRRTIVAKISTERVAQERFLRESLEQAVLEQFILTATPDTLTRLEETIQKQWEMREAHDFPGILRYDDAFHQIFYEETGHMLCHQVLTRNCVDYPRLRFFSGRNMDIQKLNIEQHEEMLRMIRERNLSDVLALLHTHLRRLFDEMKVMREQNPDFFE